MIGGSLITHECFRFDYCVKEALASLLTFCNEIIVVDAESKDGTLEWLHAEANKDNRIEIVQAEWKPVQKEGGKWLSDLANIGRRKLHSPYHFMLQADEVVHEDSITMIRAAAQTMRPYNCHRFNFWKDARHLAPHHTVCSHIVTRLAPSNNEVIGDAESIGARETPELIDVRIFHYGFLRHTPQQIEKGIAMENDFWGLYNPDYDRMKEENSRRCFDEKFGDQLIPFNGAHPARMIPWLAERGRL